MMLADHGADVLRIDRPDGAAAGANAVMERGRARVVADIRSDAGRDWVRALAATADVLLEGYRPGVMERRGLGPELLCAANPRLVYARMTGWGRTGPLAATAGHDINYIALTGALAAMGRPGERAAVPLNLVGDFGGGSMLLAFGIVCALLERERSGQGQVIDAAIVDGVAGMMGMFTGVAGHPLLSLDRAANVLAGSAPFYRTYVCADAREIAVGAIEPQFFAAFVGPLGLDSFRPVQFDRSRWAEMAAQLEALFATQPRDHWAALFDGSDACVTPVLDADEAPAHPHNAARGAHIARDGVMQPAPAPRLSRTPAALPPAREAAAMLARWGAPPSPDALPGQRA
jgi:alpha-methylacyl-CoA racemase